MECATALVGITGMIAPRPYALAACFITLLLEHVSRLVRVDTSRILTTLPAINVPPLASSVSASLPFALVAFLQSQPRSTTITALVTVHALLVLLQTGSTVPYAIVPPISARLAAFLHLIAPLAQLVTSPNLYSAPVLPVAQQPAHIL